MRKYERRFLWIALPVSLLAGFAATSWAMYQYAPLREIYPVCREPTGGMREIPGRMRGDFFSDYSRKIYDWDFIVHKSHKERLLRVPYSSVDLNRFANFTRETSHKILLDRRAKGIPTPHIPGEERRAPTNMPTPSCAIVAEIAIVDPDPILRSRLDK